MSTASRPRIPLLVALLPLIFLIGLLTFNVAAVFGDDALSGSNQVILILSGMLAAGLGLFYGVRFEQIFESISTNIKDTGKAILILFMIGALTGTWLISGVIPAFIYYGLQVLNPTFFLPACVIICALISLATGSSWSTTATIGIALMGIGEAMGISLAMTAGAVISGAYFGDKMSPLSDTTNLASAMAGTDIFTHIRYMVYTSVPSILIAVVVFTIIGLYQNVSVSALQSNQISQAVWERFNITPWLFLVPVITIFMIIRKVDAVVSILMGALAAAVFALIFQPGIVLEVSGAMQMTGISAYRGIMLAMYDTVSLSSSNPVLADLLTSGGMSGMMGTVWLILSAMVFGGAMEATGFLRRITEALITLAKTTASLITTTLATCGLLNITASDQYLAIVVPGRMYRDIYRERGLAPENLSRSLEDSGTVTSVLVPWNTCGAYQSGVLGVATGDYFLYALFNWLSPLMSLFYAVLGIRIARLPEPEASANNSKSATRQVRG